MLQNDLLVQGLLVALQTKTPPADQIRVLARCLYSTSTTCIYLISVQSSPCLDTKVDLSRFLLLVPFLHQHLLLMSLQNHLMRAGRTR